MENSTTVRAETVEKAVKIGLTKLGLDRHQVTINVINEGKRGLFGFGRQDAIVEVRSIQSSFSNQIEEVIEESHSTQVDSINDEVTDVTSIIESEQLDSKNEVTQEVSVEVSNEIISKTYLEAEEVEEENDLMFQHEEVARYLEKVIDAYGAETQIKVETGPNQVIFNIETEKSGYIIGKHGKIINALQVLAQVMVHQYDKRRQSVILNIGDYRDRRATILEQIAERTAKEVLRTKRSVVLDPLPSYERKQIHAYLSKIDHIETHSEGKEPNRYLVVEYQV